MMHTIPSRESMAVEPESDRGPLPGRDLVLGIVGMPNAVVDTAFLDVEDDDTITGLHSCHQNVSGLAAWSRG